MNFAGYENRKICLQPIAQLLRQIRHLLKIEDASLKHPVQNLLGPKSRLVVVASHDPALCDSGCFDGVFEMSGGRVEEVDA